MPLGLIGLKVGMTQVYDEAGKASPVTILEAGPCPVLLVRDQNRDGYDAVQIGFKDKARRKASRAERGHVAGDLQSKRRSQPGMTLAPKANCEPQRYVKEFRLDKPAEFKVGDILTADLVFKEIKSVDVIGKSKGRGFTGVMKRHNFKGLRGSHGVKKGNRQHGRSARMPATAAAAVRSAASAWPVITAPRGSPSAT